MRVAVVVLGDIGRSPRMCYHALSLAEHGCMVDLVGYTASQPHHRLTEHPRIRMRGVVAPPDWFDRLPSMVSFGLKFLWTLVCLFAVLFFCTGLPSFVLLQNPPGIPCLAVCWLTARIKRAKLVVDWHNYTSSVLRHKVDADRSSRTGRRQNNSSFLVRVAERWECVFGPKSDLNLCVTHAMRADLLRRWQVRAVTLYDRPPEWKFQAMDLEQKHTFFTRLAADQFYVPFWREADCDEQSTRFSYQEEDGSARLRAERPAILVSSTSWTIDEDFGILLSALQRFDALARSEKPNTKEDRLPKLVAIITGKGPMKVQYMEQINKLHMEHVEIITPWLPAEDYPRLLHCADLGVSLHTSTSGLDLPMKVVDMFGCSLPVLAKRFACIDELVREGENGHTFESPQELCDWLGRLLRGFPDHSTKLCELRNNLGDQPLVCWEDNWDATVWPLLKCG